ncbi:MAG TPA: periplasmic heavy metal sensor [Terriglobales bacterium]|nr:periplasmic heavy metal sensor [Terriglobales bacterium]
MRWGAFGGQGLWLDRIARNPEARQRLGLSDEQARQIEAATLDFQKARINNRAQQQIARLQLRDALTAAQPDEGAIDQQLQSLSALRLAEEKAAIHYRLSLRSMLTPAQRQTLRQLVRRRFARRGGFAPGGRGSMPRSGRVPPRASGPEN